MRPAARLALLGGSRALAAALGSLSTMILARALAPEALGLWSAALAVQGYALHLGELGLRGVATAAAARAPGRVGPLLARYLALRLGSSSVVAGAVAGAALLLAPGSAPVHALAAASILAFALQLDWLALADDRPALAAALLLARPVAYLLLLLAARDSLTPEGAAGCFLDAAFLAAGLSWMALRRPPGAEAARDEKAPDAGALLRAGLPLCGATLLSQTLLSADVLLAGTFLGTAAAAHYFIASQVAVSLLVVANAAGQAAPARLARHAPDGPAFAAALASEARAVGGCGLLLGAALLAGGPTLLPRLFGPAYAEAVPVLLALLPWFLLRHVTTLLQGALTATGQGGRVLRADLAMVAALLPCLLAASLAGSLAFFAAGRLVGEAARLASLAAALPPEARRALVAAVLPVARTRRTVEAAG